MRLVAGFSPRWLGFDLGPVHVRFVVAKLAPGQGFLRVLRCYPVSVILPMHHTHFYLQAALTRKTKQPKPGNLPKSSAVSEIRDHWVEKDFNFSFFKELNYSPGMGLDGQKRSTN